MSRRSTRLNATAGVVSFAMGRRRRAGRRRRRDAKAYEARKHDQNEQIRDAMHGFDAKKQASRMGVAKGEAKAATCLDRAKRQNVPLWASLYESSTMGKKLGERRAERHREGLKGGQHSSNVCACAAGQLSPTTGKSALGRRRNHLRENVKTIQPVLRPCSLPVCPPQPACAAGPRPRRPPPAPPAAASTSTAPQLAVRPHRARPCCDERPQLCARLAACEPDIAPSARVLHARDWGDVQLRGRRAASFRSVRISAVLQQIAALSQPMPFRLRARLT